MKRRRKLIVGSVLAAAVVGLGIGQKQMEAMASSQQMVTGPIFEVDPLWPKPLPNGWIMGNVIGVGVDSRDHVFIVHRVMNPGREVAAQFDPPQADCCSSAPPILEFDPEGNLVNAWGGPPADSGCRRRRRPGPSWPGRRARRDCPARRRPAPGTPGRRYVWPSAAPRG